MDEVWQLCEEYHANYGDVYSRSKGKEESQYGGRLFLQTGNTLWFKKNAPTLADYNYDPVQSILIIFSKLFVNDHKSCLVVKLSTSPHICRHYTL